LPKIHKHGIPIRPILAAIKSHSYSLAKFLVSLLRPSATNPYTINDSFSFIQELMSLNVNTNNVIMASFDVTFLFTNIPLDETIDIISDQLYSTQTFYHSFSKTEFVQLLNLAVKNCHFIFDGKYYDQIDGVAMGSPLGPLFANILLSFHEKEWLDNCPDSFKPIFFRRYVDDSFALFNSHDHIVPFLDYLNSKHPNIKFTFEIENEYKTLPFVDISIKRVNGNFETSVYPKPTLYWSFYKF
jgi:hypothetical protein